MRFRWMVLVTLKEGGGYGRTFGNFDSLADAETLAARINKGLGVGYIAITVPYFQGVTSGRAALSQIPDHWKAD